MNQGTDPQVVRVPGGGRGRATGQTLRDQEQGVCHSCQARPRVLVCTFLDPSKILLCGILGQYLSDVVLKQIMQG